MGTTRESWREWERRVEAWRRSGESAAVFASRHGWNPKTLAWWSSVGLSRKRASGAPAHFVEVEQSPVVPRVGRVEIVLGNGRRLRLSDGISPEYIRHLIGVLEA